MAFDFSDFTDDFLFDLYFDKFDRKIYFDLAILSSAMRRAEAERELIKRGYTLTPMSIVVVSKDGEATVVFDSDGKEIE